MFFWICETTDVLFMTSWMTFEMGRKFTCGKKTYIFRYVWRTEGNLLLLCNHFSNGYGRDWWENLADSYVVYITVTRNGLQSKSNSSRYVAAPPALALKCWRCQSFVLSASFAATINSVFLCSVSSILSSEELRDTIHTCSL